MLYIYLISGAILLYFGAESLIKGASSFAKRAGLPLMIVGLTIMGYGTGTPELIVSVQASFAGNGDIALGNVIGSNIANTALIVGIAAMLRPISVKRHFVQFHCPMMVIISVAFCFMLFFVNTISGIYAIIFLIAFICYTFWIIFLGKTKKEYQDEIVETVKITRYSSIWLEIVLILVGFFLLFWGGKFFLDGAVLLAKKLNISDAHIALSVVALGTSLPELATSIVAVIKKHEDIALANIVGSNVFNILAIIGGAAAISPINIVDIKFFDSAFMAFLALLLLVFIRSASSIRRWEGFILFSLYCSYITYLFY